MKALSIYEAKSYLAGCLKGDACITKGQKNSIHGYLQLRVADFDFAATFRDAIATAYDLTCHVRTDERGYAVTRTYNGYDRFSELRSWKPVGDACKTAWIRGLFDSEGNVVCSAKPKAGPRSWDRRISIFSTVPGTLEVCQSYLLDIEIPSVVRKWPSSKGHLGQRQVYALLVKNGRDTYVRFSSLISSAIARKREKLILLPKTYQDDLAACARQSQEKGVRTRLARLAAGGTY